MSEISKEIGQNIRRTRKMRKITHQQLAQAIGKSQSAISKYESGEIAVDIDTLYAIADALQVHIETLLYFPNTATTIASTRQPGIIAFLGRDGVSTRRSTCTITLPRFAFTA